MHFKSMLHYTISMDLSKPSHHAWHSFCVRPQIKFETQTEGEEVILVLRAHPVTLIPWIINTIFLFVILIFIDNFLPNFLSTAQIFFVNLIAITAILFYIWFNILSYLFNVGIVTNQRVVDVDLSGIIYKEVTEAKLSKIEDITDKTSGYFASVFNFGDVFIQTAGTEENIEFLKVPRPADVVRIINDLTS